MTDQLSLFSNGKHTSHRMHTNSLQTFEEEKPKLTGRRQAVYEWVKAHGRVTDRQVMQGMGFSDMNAVRPRLTELVDNNFLKEVATVICPVTHKRVRVVEAR